MAQDSSTSTAQKFVRRLVGLSLLAAFGTGAAPSLGKDCGPGDPRVLTILTTDSFTGKGSLAELLREEFAKTCEGCKLEILTPKGSSNLLGRLKSEKRRGCSSKVEAVLGLDIQNYEAARKDKLVAEGAIFDRGVFAFIADTKRLPKSEWPKSWKEVPSKLKGKVLVQDPRLSSPGIGWLRALYEMKALPEADGKSLPARVFPSWSSAYDAFLKGQGSAVWSYVTSESYHRCNEKKPEDRERYLAIPLEEGYPQQEEWLAPVAGFENRADVKRLAELVASAPIQSRIATTNWMLPASDKAELPECFRKTTDIKAWRPAATATLEDLKGWIDRWSL